jgi:hypothetical protein
MGVVVVALPLLLFGLFGTKVASKPRLAFAEQRSFLPVPVVVVVFDELPIASLMTQEGEIDGRSYPNFARLARSSTWFRNTATTGVFTKDAFPSLLTGNLPDPFVGMSDPHPRNLFTLLGKAYPVTLSNTLSGFCPVAACTLKPGSPDLDLGPDFYAFEHSERGADLTTMLGPLSRASASEPALYFAHVVLPHSPWRYLPSGQRYEEREPEPGEIDVQGPGKAWSNDEWLTTQVHQRHLLQLGVVDRLVGTIVATMKGAGIYDESLLVITADHGIAFEPGLPKRTITERTSLGWVGYVPLFIKQPMQKIGAVRAEAASVIDLLPTIADLLDLSTVWNFDGRSLLAPVSPRYRALSGFPLDPEGSEILEAVAAKYRRFASDDGALDLYGIGPGDTEQLLGLSLDQLAPGLVGSDETTILNADVYSTADPQDPAYPSLVEGKMEGTDRRTVAIVVNDRIAAMTRTYRRGDESWFYAMVPPTTFDEPPNQVTAVVLTTEI